ncbi:zinc finger protein 721-like isoform X2 [Vanessa cardui]|nr:zinc finger protein 721-like isoform X2 [Vanessa cardui]
MNVDLKLESELIIKDEIKTEEDHPQCHICLSVGRRMFPLRQHEEIYRRLLYDESPDRGDVTLDAALVCWECNASLRSVERFRSRIRQASEMLQAQQNTVSLSTLTTVVFSDSNPNGIYLSEESTRRQMDSENGDRIEDREDASETDSIGEEESLEEEETPTEKSVDGNIWAKRQCVGEFSKNIHMKNYSDLVHLKRIKFKCDSCEKYFGRNADLAKHRRRVHEGVRPPRDKICRVCGRGFTSNKLLAGHARTHATQTHPN